MSRPEPQERSCDGCGDGFVITASEQEFFLGKGLQLPRRCPACRQARRPPPGPPPAPAPPDPREVVCSACGALTRLPFEPRDDRPVYCPACFRNR